mmetsp:Transcript_4579/g.10343  ORF Transcript_4579/g.10343 Transcript_4579/m.10343 type:complete len:616 (-) Transcript_4579:81-1928(-)
MHSTQVMLTSASKRVEMTMTVMTANVVMIDDGRVDEAVGSDGDESDNNDEEDYEDSDRFQMNEENLPRLKRNDPNVTVLAVNFTTSDIYAGDVDWEREGDCIGKNTHLKSLRIEKWGRIGGEEQAGANFEAFYRAVACNRSIRHLSMGNCLIRIGDMFTILSPFFEHNHNLRSFEVGRLCMDSRGTRLLVSALSRCSNTSLRTIKFDFVGLDNEGAANIVNALAKHNNLRKLSLELDNDGVEWCDALAQLLLNPNSNLEELDLTNNRFDNNGATALGNAFAKNNTLKKFSLVGDRSNTTITSTGWVAFSRCLANPNSSLEELNLSENDIGDDGAAAFAAALASNTKLKVLDLSSTRRSVSAAGWITFFNLSRNPNSALEKLVLTGNNIGDEGLASMLPALVSMSSLKYLYLDRNLFTAPGLVVFSNLLRHPSCILERFHLTNNGNIITNEGVIAFAHALANNTSLKTLQLGNLNPRWGNITARGLAALANVLCNKSSIDSIYSSNHTLQTICDSESSLPANLVSSLQLNRNNNKFESARWKILEHYFSDGVKNLQELLEMKLKVMPHAIAWIGRDGTGFPLLYNLVRSMPVLFDSNSEAKANGAGAKRKRICQKR